MNERVPRSVTKSRSAFGFDEVAKFFWAAGKGRWNNLCWNGKQQ